MEILNDLAELLLPLKGVLAACAVLVVLMLVLRVCFGKGSKINRAVSAAVAILLMYVLAVILHCTGKEYDILLSGLPLVTVSGSQIRLLSVQNTDFPVLCSALLKTLTLALLVTGFDSAFSKNQKFIFWLLNRCLVVACAGLSQLLVCWLFESILPPSVLEYAPMILLGALVFTMLLGALKLLLGIALAVVNPIIAALYTFFFASKIGKTLSRAVLTTVILTVLMAVAEQLGFVSLSMVGANALTFLLPVAVLFGVWYIPTKLL